MKKDIYVGDCEGGFVKVLDWEKFKQMFPKDQYKALLHETYVSYTMNEALNNMCKSGILSQTGGNSYDEYADDVVDSIVLLEEWLNPILGNETVDLIRNQVQLQWNA